MKSNITITLSLPIAVVLMCGLAATAHAQNCKVDKCEMVLTVQPNSDFHLVDGDTLTLVYDGDKTVLIPRAENWESKQIALKRKEIWQTGRQGGRIVLVWDFTFKSKKEHTPRDKKHLEVHLYKDPDSAGKDWLLKDGKHSDNTIHGGTAHMTQ